MSEKDNDRFTEMLQRQELLSGSKDNVHEVFIHFLLKMNFLTLITNMF